ncbi:uncharacterized protein LOC143875715 [Tasmannia lanceolata]|uniref:uncharacterized protein LOC143875715 n=1 Tax=Tasmannia lanceolata TaxID=3420 RepID=UPI004063434F
MSKSNEEKMGKAGETGEEKNRVGGKSPGSGQQVDLPVDSSPYVKYSDLEDYKLQGYGTTGHVDPVVKLPERGGGGTDGPTLSGSGLNDRQVSGG